MKDVHAVSVMYHGRKVGTLSMGNRSNCQFEYDKDWLTDGFSISPLKLPLKAGLFTADYQPFNGNFGVFEDSLPGGYGEYLLRKVLKKSGIDPQALNSFQWLSIIGSSGSNVGVRRYVNPISGHWTTEPIVTPYFRIGKRMKLELPIGNLLKTAIWGNQANPLRFQPRPMPTPQPRK